MRTDSGRRSVDEGGERESRDRGEEWACQQLKRPSPLVAQQHMAEKWQCRRGEGEENKKGVSNRSQQKQGRKERESNKKTITKQPSARPQRVLTNLTEVHFLLVTIYNRPCSALQERVQHRRCTPSLNSNGSHYTQSHQPCVQAAVHSCGTAAWGLERPSLADQRCDSLQDGGEAGALLMVTVQARLHKGLQQRENLPLGASLPLLLNSACPKADLCQWFISSRS